MSTFSTWGLKKNQRCENKQPTFRVPSLLCASPLVCSPKKTLKHHLIKGIQVQTEWMCFCSTWLCHLCHSWHSAQLSVRMAKSASQRTFCKEPNLSRRNLCLWPAKAEGQEVGNHFRSLGGAPRGSRAHKRPPCSLFKSWDKSLWGVRSIDLRPQQNGRFC